MSAITELKKQAAEFHKEHEVTSPNLDYIDDEYILKALGASPVQALEKAEKQVGSGADERQGVSREGARSQWSGYISQVSYQGDRIYFVTPCQAPQAYYINRNQLAALNQNGICGNYTQYYAVINY